MSESECQNLNIRMPDFGSADLPVATISRTASQAVPVLSTFSARIQGARRECPNGVFTNGPTRVCLRPDVAKRQLAPSRSKLANNAALLRSTIQPIRENAFQLSSPTKEPSELQELSKRLKRVRALSSAFQPFVGTLDLLELLDLLEALKIAELKTQIKRARVVRFEWPD